MFPQNEVIMQKAIIAYDQEVMNLPDRQRGRQAMAQFLNGIYHHKPYDDILKEYENMFPSTTRQRHIVAMKAFMYTIDKEDQAA